MTLRQAAPNDKHLEAQRHLERDLHRLITIHKKMVALRPKTLTKTLKSGRTQVATHSQPLALRLHNRTFVGRKGKTPPSPHPAEALLCHREAQTFQAPLVLV